MLDGRIAYLPESPESRNRRNHANPPTKPVSGAYCTKGATITPIPPDFALSALVLSAKVAELSAGAADLCTDVLSNVV
jgi:hypothetical protein